MPDKAYETFGGLLAIFLRSLWCVYGVETDGDISAGTVENARLEPVAIYDTRDFYWESIPFSVSHKSLPTQGVSPNCTTIVR
ncbi:MAG: hypothetical protein OXH22_00430 [Chloroflexi bacterium]|nr:hypothetical protein [Chloroflexota bacterium]